MNVPKDVINAQACHHEDYHADCDGCWMEAIGGGLIGLRDLLPHADIVMTTRDETYASGTVSYEGMFLMTWDYGRGEDGIQLQEDAQQVLDDLIAYYRIQRSHWTEMVRQARAKEMPEREHQALSREGEMGKHLDRVTSWSAG